MITAEARWQSVVSSASSSYLATGLIDLDVARLAIAKKRATKHLISFVELFWPIIERLQPFVRGWVQELICEHLQAVSDERLQNLLMNVPPGFSKSTLVNVFWPAWEWGPRRRPDLRYISWSYSAKLTERDNVLCRKIVESPLYQRLWGQCAKCKVRKEGAPRCAQCESDRRFRLDGDQNAKIRYRNDWGGWRFATSVGGAGTGERADRLIFDDPHSVQGAESDADRQATVDWFAATLPSRVRNAAGQLVEIKLPEWVKRAHAVNENTEQTDAVEGATREGWRPSKRQREDAARALKSATVGIMQRVHLRDVSGVILETPELGYAHLLVEMEYDANHPARKFDPDKGRTLSPGSPIPWEDPRKAKLASIPLDVTSDDPQWDALCNLWVRIALDLSTLADPVRYPRPEVDKLKRQLLLKASGGNPVMSQLQQWPQEAGGEYFPAAVIDENHVLNLHELLPPRASFMTRAYDLAATDDDPGSAATVGVLGYIDVDSRVIIVDVVKVRGAPDAVDELIKLTADIDEERDYAVRTDLPRDPGQAGKYQINAMVKTSLLGHAVDHSPEGKSKTQRAYPLSTQWKAGNVYLVRGPWNAEYKRIMSEFPVGRFKDEVDASTRMFDSQIRAEIAEKPVPPVAIKLASNR